MQRRRRRDEETLSAPPQKRSKGSLVDHIEDLHATAGNAAVSRLIGTLPTRLATAGAGAKADGPAGTVPSKEPEEVPAHEKGKGVWKEDAPAAPGRHLSAVTPGAAQGAIPLALGTVGIDVSTPESPEEAESRPDTAAVGNVTNAFANPDTSPSSSAFGSESFKAGYKDVAFTTTDGVVKVDFTLDINCPWGTKDGGNTDVPSATSSVVTKDTYKQIVSDLTPALQEKSWRAPRSQYWSEAICKRHEKFHSTDDKAWSEGAGKQVVTNFLAGKTINPITAAADVNTHLDGAVAAMDTANFQFYTGGAASYLSYAGEERAFGDGKQPYLDLANAVKLRGEALEIVEAVGATAKKAAASIKGFFGF